VRYLTVKKNNTKEAVLKQNANEQVPNKLQIVNLLGSGTHLFIKVP